MVAECSHYGLDKSTFDYATDLISQNEQDASTPGIMGLQSNLNLYSVGDWIIVIYDGIWYPGMIEQKGSDTLKTNFMSRTGNTFFWPEKMDIQEVWATQVLSRISKPYQTGSRNKPVYRLTPQEYSRVNKAAKNCVIYETK